MPLAGQVLLLGKDPDGVLEINRLLVEGLLVLLYGILNLLELQLRNSMLVIELALLVLMTIA